MPDAVRRLLDKFDYPDREAEPQFIPILPTLGGGGGGAPTVVVAASDASDLSKSKADLFCTGTNDETTLQEAISSLGALGGRILLTEGTFSLSDSVTVDVGGVYFYGMGVNATYVEAATTNVDLFSIEASDDFSFDQLTLDGQTNAGTRGIVCTSGTIDLYVGRVSFLDLPGGAIYQDSTVTSLEACWIVTTEFVRCGGTAGQCEFLGLAEGIHIFGCLFDNGTTRPVWADVTDCDGVVIGCVFRDNTGTTPNVVGLDTVHNNAVNSVGEAFSAEDDHTSLPTAVANTGALIYRNTAQTIADATVTAVSFSTEDFDFASMADIGANPTRLTVPSDGVYHVGALVWWEAETAAQDEDRLLWVRVNGSSTIAAASREYWLGSANQSFPLAQSVHGVLKLSAGDYIEAQVFHDRGSTTDIIWNASIRNSLWMVAVAQIPIIGDGTELTIAAGVITVTTGYHTVDTQSDDATDELDTINGGNTGQLLVLKSAADARDPTVTDGTGNIVLAGGAGFTLSDTDDTITLLYDGTSWVELSRSDNS